MKKVTYDNIGIDVYKHICKNGLRVYLIPNNNVKSFFATLNVKYGSDVLKFKLNEKLIKVPVGSAHFLEHKMFEQENGVTPFDFYSALGIDCNASTNNQKTDYIFSGANSFEQSLEFLLDYVQSPYFTDKNVFKEKGIIKQEILMYEDEPSQKLYDRVLYNAYFKNPVKYSVGGRVSDIMKITKDDLYNIYDAFYQPKNMFLVVTGNINLKKTIELIENNQNKKKFKENKIEILHDEEKYEVKTKYEEITGNVVIDKFAINIKVDVSKLKEEIPFYARYISFFLESVLGNTSKLREELTNENLITSSLVTEILKAGDYTSIIIMGESSQHKKVITRIMDAIKNYKFDAREFSLNKKMLKSYYVYTSDNIYSINSFVVNQIMTYGEINEKVYLDVDKMNKEEYNYVISQVDFDNYGVVVIKPKAKK